MFGVGRRGVAEEQGGCWAADAGHVRGLGQAITRRGTMVAATRFWAACSTVTPMYARTAVATHPLTPCRLPAPRPLPFCRRLTLSTHLNSNPGSGFSPLEGFMNQADYDSVVANMRTTVSRVGGGGGEKLLHQHRMRPLPPTCVPTAVPCAAPP